MITIPTKLTHFNKRKIPRPGFKRLGRRSTVDGGLNTQPGPLYFLRSLVPPLWLYFSTQSHLGARKRQKLSCNFNLYTCGTMEKQFEIIKSTRKYLLSFITDLTIDELNEIPEGFNNNIIWNLGHLVAAQQNVCYARGGLKIRIDEGLFLAYKPDTKPAGYVDQEKIAEIKELFLSTIEQLEADYYNNEFSEYRAWTNRYGVTHNCIEDTINYLIFHEGLHVGYIMPLKRLVRRKAITSN